MGRRELEEFTCDRDDTRVMLPDPDGEGERLPDGWVELEWKDDDQSHSAILCGDCRDAFYDWRNNDG